MTWRGAVVVPWVRGAVGVPHPPETGQGDPCGTQVTGTPRAQYTVPIFFFLLSFFLTLYFFTF